MNTAVMLTPSRPRRRLYSCEPNRHKLRCLTVLLTRLIKAAAADTNKDWYRDWPIPGGIGIWIPADPAAILTKFTTIKFVSVRNINSRTLTEKINQIQSDRQTIPEEIHTVTDLINFNKRRKSARLEYRFRFLLEGYRAIQPMSSKSLVRAGLARDHGEKNVQPKLPKATNFLLSRSAESTIIGVVVTTLWSCLTSNERITGLQIFNFIRI
uniref:Uncharacterized protein n=1 Tax=Romanomermis culicivorax TaxID=13658 RepID=A0A915IV31_ROMCU